MQVSPRSSSSSKRRGSGRLELVSYLLLGAFLFFTFDFYQGRELTEYELSPAKETAIRAPVVQTPATPVTELPEVKAAIEAAVAKALKEAPKPKAKPPTTVVANTNEKQFLPIAEKTGTDKIQGNGNLPKCLQNEKECFNQQHINPRCKVFGHFYDTIYDRWLRPFAVTDEPMQFLEIGYYKGGGFEAFTRYLEDNTNAELHSMEISCLPEGSRDEGKWPWGNFAKNHKWYEDLRAKDRLHCGDASSYEFLNHIWTTKMKRPDAPPLKVVVEDASHLHDHMAQSLFYWFPRIEPGGILVVEDVQPQDAANKFRTHILPQVMKDLHWCGGSGDKVMEDSLCFPTIQPFLHGIHCELHICVFVRNDEPARELSEADSVTPSYAFDKVPKCLFN